MLLADFIKTATLRLEKLYPSPEARGLVLFLCEEKLGVKSYTHIVEPQYAVPEEALEHLESCVCRMEKAEPIQYVLGYADFYGRRFKVNPSVLIPRPETELLVGLALKDLPECGRAVDLCTGSGCIAWSLALERLSAGITAVDISEAALSVAQTQFADVANSPTFRQADVLDIAMCDLPAGSFDLLVSNPPYIMEKEKAAMRPNVLDHEPELALFVPDEDPLRFYRAVALWADLLLKPGGVGMVEINETLAEETEAVFHALGFEKIQTIQDFGAKNRIVRFSKSR